MDETLLGTRAVKGEWTPTKRVAHSPVFLRPLRPLAVARWVCGYPGYVLGYNALYLAVGAAAWWVATRSSAAMSSLSLGWIALILLRNAVAPWRRNAVAPWRRNAVAPWRRGARVHFYTTHRLIHWTPLYKLIHSLHDRNTNPAPWSGLSMQPLEHFIYISAIAIHWVVPSHPLHAMYTSFHLTMAPVPGHSGSTRSRSAAARSIRTATRTTSTTSTSR